MKLLIINPNTSDEMTSNIDSIAKKYARKETEIVTVHSRKGPVSIESQFEEAIIAEPLFERIIEGNQNDYDAIIIACYGDPHLYAAREISDIPVLGVAECSMHIASLLGYKFSIVTIIESTRPMLEELIKKNGLESRCASIKTTAFSPTDFEKQSDDVLKVLTEAAKDAVENDGAEVICLGCAGMAGIDKPMSEKLGVPVLDGVACAVKMAETLVDYGVAHSKVKAYSRPRKKEFKGFNNLFNNI
ncbi:MAG: aspartate/glutamate racemase family protein [Dethiobacteria bacterium]|jgi:allantoin racemase